jgi:hypothetical protein
MKNQIHSILIILFFTTIFFTKQLNAQINYTTSYTESTSGTTCTSGGVTWTLTGASPSFSNTTATGFSPCNTSSAKANLYSSATTTTLASGLLGVSNGQLITFSFSGKAIDYSTGTATTAGYCTYKGEWSTNGSTWTPLNTLSNISSTSCNTYTFNTFTPAAGSNVYVRIVATRVNGDFWAVMDNISVTQAACGPQGTITKTCASNMLTYDATVNINSLGGATGANILVGAITHRTNVGVGTYTITGISTSSTVYVQDVSNSFCGFNQSFPMCDPCTDAPSLPADECVNAPLIDLSQPFVGSTNCTYTASVGSPSGCGTIENDSWMKFIAASTNVEMDFTVGDCNLNFGVQLAVFSGSCGAFSLLSGSCVNPSPTPNENSTGTWNFSGLTVGNTYYIRIDGYAGDKCPYFFTPISGVVITPPNDLCADAITLTCGSSDTASNILATATDAPTACSGGGTTSKGVWYKFVGTGQSVTVSTDNSTTNFDTEINVFSGTCGALTCVGADDDSGAGTTSTYTFTATNGTTYYVYVDGKGTAVGQFKISLSCVGCSANPGTWN